jgi:hypothetical protein
MFHDNDNCPSVEPCSLCPRRTMNRTPRSPAWLALGLLAAALTIGGILSSCSPQPAPQPAPVPAAPQTPRPVAPEAQAGGQLVAGEWRFGYTPDPVATQNFLKSLPKPTIREAGPELLAKATTGEPVLLYRALYEAYATHHGGREWRVGAQGIGDCVSWGWAHGADIHLAVRWKLGESAEWRQAATEAIYGGSRVEARCGDDSCRGGYMDGSYGGAAAKWTRDWGIVFRQPYDGFPFDLSTYSSQRAKAWGNFGCGGQGDNGRLDAIAKLHALEVALVRNFDEAAAAIAAGYPIPVCSGRGFRSVRDAQGFCAPAGSWAHCMCFVAVRYDRPGLLCLNSWGPNWVSGPKWPADQPDGSFWVDASVATAMLRGGDSFAISGYRGFPWRDLKHGDWVQVDRAKRGETGEGEKPIVSAWRGGRGTFALGLAP